MHISTAHTFNFSWDDTDDTHVKRWLTHIYTHIVATRSMTLGVCVCARKTARER